MARLYIPYSICSWHSCITFSLLTPFPALLLSLTPPFTALLTLFCYLYLFIFSFLFYFNHFSYLVLFILLLLHFSFLFKSCFSMSVLYLLDPLSVLTFLIQISFNFACSLMTSDNYTFLSTYILFPTFQFLYHLVSFSLNFSPPSISLPPTSGTVGRCILPCLLFQMAS